MIIPKCCSFIIILISDIEYAIYENENVVVIFITNSPTVILQNFPLQHNVITWSICYSILYSICHGVGESLRHRI